MDKKSELIGIINIFLKDERINFYPEDDVRKIDDAYVMKCYDWMYVMCYKIRPDIHIDLLMKAIQYFSNYIAKHHDIETQKYKLLSCACMMIAEYTYYPLEPDAVWYSSITNGIYSDMDITKFVIHVLDVLNFDVFSPNVYDFLECIIELGALAIDNGVLDTLINVYIVSITNIDFNNIKPSLQLAGILYYLSACSDIIVWNEQLAIYLQKTSEVVESCAYLIYTHIKSVKNKPINTRCITKVPLHDHASPRESALPNTNTPSREITPFRENAFDTGVHSNYIPYAEFCERYKKIEEFDEGGISKVFTYIDITLNKTVVVKRTTLYHYNRDIKTVVCEIGCLHRLNGLSGIEKYYGYSYNYSEDGHLEYYVIIKKYDYTIENKFEEFQSKPSKLTFLRTCLRSVLIGSMNITMKGLVHVDLRCDNIMVDDDMEGVIIDFNIAKKIKTKSGCAYIPMWWNRAPESRSEIYHRESDIWILGMSIVHLVAGQHTLCKFHHMDNVADTVINHPPIYTKIFTKVGVGGVDESKGMNIRDNSDLKCARLCIQKVKKFDTELGDLVSHMLCRIEDRWTAAKLLTHEFFAHTYDQWIETVMIKK